MVARSKEKLRWYLNRLRCMSMGEILYRLRNKLISELQSHNIFSSHRAPPAIIPDISRAWLPDSTVVDKSGYIKCADRVLVGVLDIFSLEGIKIGIIPDWNKDQKTGTRAPLAFGKTIDYRDENIVGDIKYLWEPNRHLQFVTLCQAYRLTGEIKYLEGFKKLLTSWLEQCPYQMGPNWVSSLELGIRLINWSLCWQLIGGVNSDIFAGEEGVEFRDRWLQSVYQHSCFINGYWSRYSSANNHLVGEAAGLFVASATWPFWPKSEEWQRAASAILEEEAGKQTYPDGVNREQAISYQQFVADFLLLAGLSARAISFDFPKSYWKHIESMLEFIASIMDLKGNVPMIGDADDGYVVKLSQENTFCPYRSLLVTGGILFSRYDFLKKARAIDDKTRWLIGNEAVLPESVEQVDIRLPVRTSFNYGGYYILGTDYETESEVRMIVDCGSLGYSAISAHGHADALAVTLSVGGYEFLVDTGTYTYHVHKSWRDYFRGTAAHNTLRIDGCDQSLSGGNFMWVRHAQARSTEWKEEGEIVRFFGEHNGYMALSDPVTHSRRIILNKRKRVFELTDYLVCQGKHEVERWWHFSENCEITHNKNGIEVRNGARTIHINLEGAVPAEILRYRGSVEPIAGWISRKYDKKVPSCSVVEHMHISGPVELRAEIICF